MSNRQLDTAALNAVVKAIEAADDEIRALNEDKKEAYARARAAGIDVKVLKAVIRERRIPPDEHAAFQDLLVAYRKALGR